MAEIVPHAPRSRAFLARGDRERLAGVRQEAGGSVPFSPTRPNFVMATSTAGANDDLAESDEEGERESLSPILDGSPGPEMARMALFQAAENGELDSRPPSPAEEAVVGRPSLIRDASSNGDLVSRSRPTSPEMAQAEEADKPSSPGRPSLIRDASSNGDLVSRPTSPEMASSQEADKPSSPGRPALLRDASSNGAMVKLKRPPPPPPPLAAAKEELVRNRKTHSRSPTGEAGGGGGDNQISAEKEEEEEEEKEEDLPPPPPGESPLQVADQSPMVLQQRILRLSTRQARCLREEVITGAAAPSPIKEEGNVPPPPPRFKSITSYSSPLRVVEKSPLILKESEPPVLRREAKLTPEKKKFRRISAENREKLPPEDKKMAPAAAASAAAAAPAAAPAAASAEPTSLAAGDEGAAASAEAAGDEEGAAADEGESPETEEQADAAPQEEEESAPPSPASEEEESAPPSPNDVLPIIEDDIVVGPLTMLRTSLSVSPKKAPPPPPPPPTAAAKAELASRKKAEVGPLIDSNRFRRSLSSPTMPAITEEDDRASTDARPVFFLDEDREHKFADPVVVEEAQEETSSSSSSSFSEATAVMLLPAKRVRIVTVKEDEEEEVIGGTNKIFVQQRSKSALPQELAREMELYFVPTASPLSVREKVARSKSLHVDAVDLVPPSPKEEESRPFNVEPRLFAARRSFGSRESSPRIGRKSRTPSIIESDDDDVMPPVDSALLVMPTPTVEAPPMKALDALRLSKMLLAIEEPTQEEEETHQVTPQHATKVMMPSMTRSPPSFATIISDEEDEDEAAGELSESDEAKTPRSPRQIDEAAEDLLSESEEAKTPRSPRQIDEDLSESEEAKTPRSPRQIDDESSYESWSSSSSTIIEVVRARPVVPEISLDDEWWWSSSSGPCSPSRGGRDGSARDVYTAEWPASSPVRCWQVREGFEPVIFARPAAVGGSRAFGPYKLRDSECFLGLELRAADYNRFGAFVRLSDGRGYVRRDVVVGVTPANAVAQLDAQVLRDYPDLLAASKDPNERPAVLFLRRLEASERTKKQKGSERRKLLEAYLEEPPEDYSLDLAYISDVEVSLLNRTVQGTSSLLLSLSLKGTTLGDSGIIQLASSTALLRSLRRLCIQRTGCGRKGALALASALRSGARGVDAYALTALRTLEVDYNPGMGDEGATSIVHAAIGDFPARPRPPTTLGLSGCGCGASTARAIATCLRGISLASSTPPSKKPRLETLRFADQTFLGSQSAIAILEACTTSLTSIDLSGNQKLGESFAFAFATLVPALSSMRCHIKLDRTAIKSNGLESILRASKRRSPRFLTITIEGNVDLDDDDRAALDRLATPSPTSSPVNSNASSRATSPISPSNGGFAHLLSSPPPLRF